MPAIYKREPTAMPRGVSNRRAALNWIRLNHDVNDSGAVIYFGDDDNTFHLDLFKEIRTTKKVSMFPVGLIGKYGVSSPIVDKVGIHTRLSGKRLGGRTFVPGAVFVGYLLNRSDLTTRPKLFSNRREKRLPRPFTSRAIVELRRLFFRSKA